MHQQEEAAGGSYKGGPIPFGCDLLCLAGGNLIWRFVPLRTVPKSGRDGRTLTGKNGGSKWDYLGIEIREGSQREVVGIPPHRKASEQVSLAPTVVAERLRVLRDIFAWFGSESLSFGEIARRLNADPNFVQPVGSESKWYGQRIDPLLRNSIYMGLPTPGNFPRDRFLDWRGADQPSPTNDRNPGETLTSRRLRKGLWLSPSQMRCEPLIGRETWDRVQAKLDKPTRRPAPRHESLWLRGIPVCGKCGRALSGQEYKKKNGAVTRRYCCQTARKFGESADNPTGCLHHAIRHDHLEAVLIRYLDATARSLEILKAVSETDKAAVQNLIERSENSYDKLYVINEEMKIFVVENLGGEGDYELLPEPDQKWVINVEQVWGKGKPHWSLDLEGYNREGPYDVGLNDIYGYFLQNRRRSVEREIAELTQELDRGSANLLLLKDPRLVQRLEGKLGSIQTRIDTLTASLESLEDRFSDLMSQYLRLRESVGDLRAKMEQGSERLKSEAVGRVVDKMVVHYRYIPYGDKERSIPSRVDVHGTDGDCLSFKLDFPGGDPKQEPTISESNSQG